MKEKPALIIMAAGMGSRYGGLKQIEPVDGHGHIIMDFSIYDALKAGFGKIVFVIKKENEEVFRETVGKRVEDKAETAYVFQEISDLPAGYEVPEGRKKPWGTAHAVLCCRNAVKGPFAVINADDYYGKHAFGIVHDYLDSHTDDEKMRFVMAGFVLGNTLTENGHVARGVCTVDEEGYLKSIVERTHIEKRRDNAVFTEDGGATFRDIPFESIVSMNMWGFSGGMMKELEKQFPPFLDRALAEDPEGAEYFLPSVVSNALEEGRATVSVKMTPDRWYGVTYREDRENVVRAIAEMEEKGIYPRDF